MGLAVETCCIVVFVVLRVDWFKVVEGLIRVVLVVKDFKGVLNKVFTDVLDPVLLSEMNNVTTQN